MLPRSLRPNSDLPSKSYTVRGNIFWALSILLKSKPQSMCCHQLALVNQCKAFLFSCECMDFIKSVLTVLFSLIIFGFYWLRSSILQLSGQRLLTQLCLMKAYFPLHLARSNIVSCRMLCQLEAWSRF